LASYSSNLDRFFPKKAILKRNESVRREFFDENKLLDVEYGVAFSAGLLDGDGHCQVAWEKRGFRSIVKWKWQFDQSRQRCIFLVAYIERLVKSLSPDGGAVRVRSSGRGKARVSIWKPGISALLKVGIARYSWKVAQWLKKSAEYQREREKYCTVGQVARILGASDQTVRGWYDSGRIRGCRRRGGWHFIPITELEKLREWLKEESRKVDSIKSEGVKLADACRMAGVSRSTIWRLCRIGKLPSTLVRERDRTYLVIPIDSVRLLTSQEIQ
jgi:hypothetical protein